MTLVKICGLRDIHAFNAAKKADYIGFIVGSPKSHRNVSLNHLEEFLVIKNRPKIVAVSVNSDMRFLHELDELKPDVIQLHGLARKYHEKLKSKISIALTIEEYTEGLYSEKYQEFEYIVIDTVDVNYGGTGKKWKWRKLQNTSTPILIAGGISPDNFIEALKKTNGCGIDVSSSLENRGRKCPELIFNFIHEVRNL